MNAMKHSSKLKFLSFSQGLCCLSRKMGKLTKFIESQKEKFTQLDLQDVEVREKLKHTKNKTKKLHKQLQKDKEKVCVIIEQCLFTKYK